MHGRQLSDMARQLRPGVKVLFVTGLAGTTVLERHTGDDEVDLLAKPFGIDALNEKILSMTAQTKPALPAEAESDSIKRRTWHPRASATLARPVR